MSDIAAWLETLGLDQHAETFAENDIDLEVLSELSDQDLRELGLSMGHRRKLLKAAAALSNDSSGAPQPETGATAPPKAPAAERRQLTVMFVDLVDSTALSAQLDPEDMRELILTYQNAVAGKITRFEGHVAKYMGDGVLAYFGWPRAHEDEAERAVRAALAVNTAVGKLRTPEQKALAARIGIATGLVVVGDLIGEGAAQEEAVVGETPNLAARLQALAEPDAVVVNDTTRRLLGGVFELRALAPQTLKGIADPVPVYRVLRERPAESRFQAQRAGGGVLPLMGRGHELAQLLERWQQVKCGEGRMVLLNGEAGIGKSRIVQALTDSLAKENYYRIGYQCSPYHSDNALYPAIRQLTQAAGFTAVDSVETRLDKLEALLKQGRPEQTSDDEFREIAALIAALLGLGGEARYGRLELTPQQQRSRTLQALLEQLIGLARQQPVLFLLEDVHWLDPTTLELIELTLDAIASERVLLLLSARPTFEHRFGGHPRVTRLMLNRLGREPSLALIERLGGGKALPGEVLDEIIRKTDGVPLFVEELTKTVLESRLLHETADAYVLDGPLASFEIPSSLQDSLMARLDRLQPVREVAQMAACIGREFDYRLLVTVTRLDAQELQAALAQLIEAELIFQRGLLPDASYTFKHALVRDAAYESLLKSKRQQVHAALFNALKTGDQVAFEILAHHATAASLNDQAIDYWQKAGERALAQPALSEAVHHLRTAIQLTRSMGDARQWLERELSLQVMLAQAWIARAGYTAGETIAAFRRARELSDSLDGSPLLFPILNGHWVTHHGQARHSEALAIADEALRLARKASTDVPVMIANQQFAVSSLMTGQLSKARQHFETATGLHRPVEHAWIARQFGHEQGIAARMLLSAALWLLGYPEQSNKERSTAVQLATDVDHATTTSFVLAWSLISAHLARNQPEKQRLMQPMAAVAEKHDLALWRLMGKLFYGIAVAESGDAAGFRLIDECIEQLDGVQFHAFKPLWRTEQARLLLAHGRIDEARSVISSARAIIASTGERWAEAETRRVEGDIRLASDSSRPDAESCYRESLAVARSQQARLWELRATTSLARLWCDQGKHQEAHDLLTPVYDWFTEGFDTADLKDARALLDTLA